MALASNKFTRLLLKMIDADNYHYLKSEARRIKLHKRYINYAPPALLSAPRVCGRPPTFKHSGNAGDVIYALPALRLLSGNDGGVLSLRLGVPIREKSIKRHPLGGVQLNQTMYDLLQPLLSAQSYLKAVVIDDGSPVDFDLDTFRDSPLPLDRLGISRWYFYMFGLAGDLSEPWLQVEPDSYWHETIIVARSMRYRNLALDYSCLEGCGNIVFVGLFDEFADFRKCVPSAQWVRVRDFLELARMIAGCRFFIGNQSFPFSLAEGLKVRRILESDPGTPNVVPTGSYAYDVLFQKQFECVVAKLLEQAFRP
jgi:hypothetical protein